MGTSIGIGRATIGTASTIGPMGTTSIDIGLGMDKGIRRSTRGETSTVGTGIRACISTSVGL